ncbi:MULTISPECIES: flavin reductase [Gordonibacter]|uniref:Flavin reductase n=1 Tax=Gordonibacter faecis TaxID=3047475 RepID=A0ABT7DN87_9ACTN|nr:MULTISPECIES: flavin reductase [unclassified Gordonibacter]MDJ1650996.1 flavin reductase [Gordonibacter sp. KGMB12511]HIW76960.1 flavin reductase [Candidatus Gordonibacter avicola]
MIDQTAFFSLSYGLYVISSKHGDRAAGCIANTFQQVTSEPMQVSVALNKGNVTTEVIRSSGRFSATCLAQDAPMELIGTFGFHSSTDLDKFAACESAVNAAGLPYVAEHACAHYSARVVQEVDLGTHILFVGEVEEAEKLTSCEPMTYAYYHQVKGGKTPPKASSYLPDADAAAPATSTSAEESQPKYAWRCTVCGHIEYADELPEDYTCPICGVGKDLFERIEL